MRTSPLALPLPLLAGAAILAASSLCARGAAKTISVDGDPSDWGPADILYADEVITDGDPAASSYAAVYVANDAEKLYLGIQTKGSGGGDINNPWIHRLYLDADQDPGTGYTAGAWAGGYDFQILYGDGGFEESLYAFAGADPAADDWGYLTYVANAASDSFIELALLFSDLGVAVGDSVRLQLRVTGTGVTVETWAPADEASALAYTLAEPRKPVSRTIVLDGDLSDWGPEYIFYTDAEIGDGEPENSTYRAIYVANDADYLYVGFDVKGIDGGNVSNNWLRQVFIDSDDDPTTGFTGSWMTHGYDRLVEWGNAFGLTAYMHAFAGANQTAWAWSGVGDIAYGYSQNAIEWGLPRDFLGVGTNTQVVLEFSVPTHGPVTTETWAHANEAEAKTYAFTTENPQPMPIIQAFSLDAGTLRLDIGGLLPGYSNTVERATRLAPPNWTTIESFTSTGTATNWTTPPGGQPAEFFRVQ